MIEEYHLPTGPRKKIAQCFDFSTSRQTRLTLRKMMGKIGNARLGDDQRLLLTDDTRLGLVETLSASSTVVNSQPFTFFCNQRANNTTPGRSKSNLQPGPSVVLWRRYAVQKEAARN